MTAQRTHPVVVALALVPGVLIGALVLVLAYPFAALAGWALREDVK